MASFNPHFFPPPPTTTTPASTKKNIKLSFKTREQQPKPILKHPISPTKRPRQYILLALLVLSFTILILSMIYSYCTALPHSDNPNATATEPTATATMTLVPISSIAAEATSIPPSRRDTAASPTLASIAAQDALDRKSFSRPSAMAALVFYTALLPLLSMAHTTFEVLVSLIKPTSQHSRLGDLILARSPTSSRRLGTLLSFSVSASLVLSWMVQILFWTNCEISSFSASGQDVCPVQIRGHHMFGIDELSIAKVVLGWVLVLGYVGYMAFLVVKVGVFGRKKVAGAGFLRKARFARGASRDEEDVVIGIQMKETR